MRRPFSWPQISDKINIFFRVYKSEKEHLAQKKLSNLIKAYAQGSQNEEQRKQKAYVLKPLQKEIKAERLKLFLKFPLFKVYAIFIFVYFHLLRKLNLRQQ